MTGSRASDVFVRWRALRQRFHHPDVAGLAESFGMPARRCDRASSFGRHLRHARGLDGPSLIVLPIDDSVDVAIFGESARRP